MKKSRRLEKHKRSAKNKRTTKNRRTTKHKRTVKHKRSMKYGGDQQFTPEERSIIIEMFKEQLPEVQNALKNDINALDVIVEFYTFIIDNANPLLKVTGFRNVLYDKMSQIETKENIWFDLKYRNENNINMNLLKPKYLKKKAKLQDLLEKYNRLY